MTWIVEILIGRGAIGLGDLVDKFFKRTSPWGYSLVILLPLAMIGALIWASAAD